MISFTLQLNIKSCRDQVMFSRFLGKTGKQLAASFSTAAVIELSVMPVLSTRE
jgi:hypothetical protein